MVQTEDQATTVSMSVNGEDRWSGDMDGLKTSPEAAAAFVEILTDAGGGTMTYAIAQYLTDEQKQRAVSAVYVPLKADGRLPRANGCCPLGVAMHARSTPWLNCQLDPSFHAQITANSGARQWSLVGCPTLTPTFILERSI